ncbi:DUF1128 domain-containing protein [Alkalihalobacterium bogoriense]|uniref:DUF1128 domain-containing protein n=1 Tax=Alkalihalobacterium bogoriense TaxID=246272 RepID=UPI00047A9934|nr:DUF1128 domain-containing protein [Alkalihalobacterium bogoriense]
MDLTVQSEENLHYMIEEIKRKLQVVNVGAIRAEGFDLQHYEDIFDIYEMLNRQSRVSVREIEAIIAELSKFRKEEN